MLASTVSLVSPARIPGIRWPGLCLAPDNGDGGTGTGTAGNDEQGDDGTKGDDESEPRFSQKQLDEVVGRRLEQERRKWDREFKQKLDEALKAHTAEAQDAKDKPKGKDEGVIPRAEYDHLKSQLERANKEAIAEKDALIAERDQQIAALLDEKRNSAIIAAAASLSPVNAKQIAKLVADQVGFDEDGSIVVFGPDGKSPRYGKDGNYLTVEDFMAEFAKTNPHLFKAEVTGGGGSKPGSSGNKAKQNQNLSSTQRIAAGLAKLKQAGG
ncbi:hypothetical protein D3C72_561660 [compost metagenome]